MVVQSHKFESGNSKSQSNSKLDPVNRADELLTIAEVAAYLKLSRRTAWRWCKTGRLPAFKVGHQWRVAQRDLEEFIHWQGKLVI